MKNDTWLDKILVLEVSMKKLYRHEKHCFLIWLPKTERGMVEKKHLNPSFT